MCQERIHTSDLPSCCCCTKNLTHQAAQFLLLFHIVGLAGGAESSYMLCQERMRHHGFTMQLLHHKFSPSKYHSSVLVVVSYCLVGRNRFNLYVCARRGCTTDIPSYTVLVVVLYCLVDRSSIIMQEVHMRGLSGRCTTNNSHT
jgi:hypothetical protein